MLREPEITFEESGVDLWTVRAHCVELDEAYEKDRNQSEYGLSFGDWCGDNERITNKLCDKWWSNLPLHQKQKFINDEVACLTRRIERDMKKREALNKCLDSVRDYNITKNCLGSDRTFNNILNEFEG